MMQNLDDFLQSQAAAARLRATIEPVPDVAQVKVTPWVQSSCGCHASLIIPKSAVGAVSATGDQHFCCGKFLQIVDLEFSEEGRAFHSIFGQLLGRQSEARVRRVGARSDEDCETACGDAYQNCLDGCDPRDGGCIYSCKLKLQRCMQRCQEPPPSAPPEDIPTESCVATIVINAPFVGEITVTESLSNTLHLSGPTAVRVATIDPFKIVRDATTEFTPHKGKYVRATGAIQIPGSVKVTFAGSSAVTNVLLTTGSVKSPSGKYQASGAPLDPTTREFTLVAAGALGISEYFVSVVATLTVLPS